jgi:adenine-specific DNA-methyltransferase
MPTLHWIGKEKVENHHLDVPVRSLDTVYTEGAAASQNKIIHGDNLEALKALLPQYEGKIKCIYIDPPYNTGNEGWVYNDNVNDPKIKKWLGQVVGKESEDLSRHDKWLCMMYPRLQLLKKLLADDGAIFISIDDNEQAHLKLVCDEVFGKNNFLAQLIWNSEGNTDNQLEIKINHEYVFVYLKRIQNKKSVIGKVIDPNTREDSNLWKGLADNNINKNSPANPPELIELPKDFPCTEESLFYKAKNLDESFFEITKQDKFVMKSKKYLGYLSK